MFWPGKRPTTTLSMTSGMTVIERELQATRLACGAIQDHWASNQQSSYSKQTPTDPQRISRMLYEGLSTARGLIGRPGAGTGRCRGRQAHRISRMASLVRPAW